jgi:hypothetical protein
MKLSTFLFELSFSLFYNPRKLEMRVMRSQHFALVALLSTFAILVAVPAFGAFFPVEITGFNRDIMWGPDGGLGGGYADDVSAGSGTWCTYVTGTSDANGNTRTDGLPIGNFTSLSNSNHTYALAAAGGDTPSNNVLWLTPSAPTGTLTLASPGTYTEIGVVSAAPDNGAEGTITLNYSDSTSATTNFSNGDWFSSSAPSNAACKGGISSYGAGTLDNCHFVDYAVNLYLTEQVITADSTKTLTGITFTQTGGPGNINFFAVSGSAVPEPSAIALVVSGTVGLLAYAWRKRK